MKRLLACFLALFALCGGALRAQDVTGNWQGTLQAGKELRLVLKVTKDDGRLKAVVYSIDQAAPPLNASSAVLNGVNFKFTVDTIGATYEGKLSADGSSIAGTWTQGPTPLPLTFARATKETAWEIPPPPAPPKLMAADANPAFDVATIKPSQSTATSMQQLTMNGRNFKIRNGSLVDIMGFAYDVQAKQIAGGPEWMATDRYDIDAVPDQEGAPNPQQLRMMIRKMVVERFKMKFHTEKRDLPAYVLTVAKSGQKLTATQMKGPLPGLFFRPATGGLVLNVSNGTMTDLTGFFQNLVLDRPVVDHTGLTDRYDFHVTFTPDDSEFNGHPPKLPPPTETTESAPNLFDAMQQELGLKLTAEKTAVDVMVIDHVEKRSEN